MSEESNSNFDGAPARPEQDSEQLRISEQVTEYMRDVVDPELGINVVDLGLVYDVWVETNESGTHTGVVNMTLTSPACPLTDMIEDSARQSVLNNTEVEELDINWVWMPPWGPHMITDEGREQLRALGFSV